jgi:hypothetical protein
MSKVNYIYHKVLSYINCYLHICSGNANAFPGSINNDSDRYEFAITHNTRKEFQFYALSEDERNTWMDQCAMRTGRINNTPINDTHSQLPNTAFINANNASRRALGKANVSVTQTALPLVPLNNSRVGRENPYGIYDNQYVASSQLYGNPPPPTLGNTFQSNGDIHESTLLNNNTQSSNGTPSRFGALLESKSSGNLLNNIKNQSNKFEYAVADSKIRDEEVKKQSAIERSELERDLKEKVLVFEIIFELTAVMVLMILCSSLSH